MYAIQLTLRIKDHLRRTFLRIGLFRNFQEEQRMQNQLRHPGTLNAPIGSDGLIEEAS
jgi:hypothetical protein